MSNLPSLLSEDTVAALEKRAEILSKSSIIPYGLKGKPADIVVILMMAYELDIPPIQAISGINVINGRATISPQLMIALIRRRIPDAVITVKPEGDIRCTCFMSRGKSKADMDQGYTAVWDMARAQKMGLSGKDNYNKQPGTMLKWRAIGEAARVVFPDILSGLYFPDEMINEEDEAETTEEGEIKNAPLIEDRLLITTEDRKALVEIMRQTGWTPAKLRNVCMDKYKIGDSSALNKAQYKELIEFINNNDPAEIVG